MPYFSENNVNLTFDLFRKAESDSFVFSYRGPFNSELTSKFVGISEQMLISQGELKRINRKFSFLLVETFQNILKHGENVASDVNGHFSFRNSNNFLAINSINLVSNSQVDELENMVNSINELSQDELKDAWRTKLLEGEFSEKGGAGLGLLEIVRRSGQAMKYRFDDLSIDYKKFHQQVVYVNDDKPLVEDIDYIDETCETNRLMNSQDVIFEYKGIISQKMIFPMMNIIERSVGNNPLIKEKIKLVTHVLMEMLQNIPESPCADRKREGVCVIQRTENEFILNTGNIICNSEVKVFDAHLKSLKNKTIKELKLMHLNRIQQVVGTKNKDSSGLGLIEIARYSEGNMSYSFDKITEEKSFFTLRVCI